ncbi:armadillo-type protein [Mycena leptocephala]|nr:armadillo-type protein [Mycena leptocephala]
MAASWVSPPTRTELIEDLVSGVDRYNPSNVSILEDYLYHQIRSQEYDCLANLAILKLYQFNPDLYNPDVVINILIKALTASPLPDFNLCISLLDERPINASLDEPDPFQPYSDELESLRDNYTVECVGFEDAVREVAIRAVKATFTQISADRLASYLDLNGSDLADFVQKKGWKMETNIEATVVQENIKLAQLTKVIAHGATM